MTFKESLKILGIEEYGQRIWNSNSRGELFHLEQYFHMAEVFGEAEWFPKWFEAVVKQAEKEWDRPESVFQHINTILIQHLKERE